MKTVLGFLFICAVTLLTAIVFLRSYSTAVTAETYLQSPLPQDRSGYHRPLVVTQTPIPILHAQQPKENVSLDTLITEQLAGEQGSYSMVIKNLKTGQWYRRNEHQVYESASLYKLWIMATVYQQIAEGRMQPDTLLSEDVATLNKIFQIDPQEAELTDGAVTFTVNDALEQMITISHNYAAMLLSEKVRLSTVATYLKDNGFTESIVGTTGDPPTVSAADSALFMEKLYRGQLADELPTEEMLTLLKNQKLNNKLPKYLPDGVVVAHKTGEIAQFSHDVGIVYAPSGPYIIALLSQTDNPPAAEERMASISRVVYDYFANSPQ